MKIGEIVHFAWWLTGYETTEDLMAFAEGTREAMAEASRREGVVFGPTATRTLYPDSPEAPEVPDHIFGPDVRMLVVESRVVAMAANGNSGPGLFAADLEPDDLARLRKITREAYAEIMPHMPRLTDRQCDTLINDLGPEAAADALTQGATNLSGVLH